MAIELECSVCEADISLEGDERSGDLIMCSYRKGIFKLLGKKDKWTLMEELEE
jgi:hypothetical protein